MVRIFALFFFLLPSLSLAQSYAPVTQDSAEPYHRAVVRVDVGGGIGIGTLIAVDGKGFGAVLTAAHVVDAGSKYRVGFAATKGSTAYLIAKDQRLDIALLHVAVPADVDVTIPLANARPEPGTNIELCGYGGWRWGVLRTKVRGYFSHHWANHKTDIGLQHIAIPGESGGPILCFEDGAPRVAGVIWGGKVTQYKGPMDFGQGADCEQVKAWLKQAVKPKFPWVLP